MCVMSLALGYNMFVAMLGTVMVALLYAGSDYEKTCLLTLRAARHINAFD